MTRAVTCCQAGGLPVIVTTLGFTFLGEALRDIVDPRLQQGR